MTLQLEFGQAGGGSAGRSRALSGGENSSYIYLKKTRADTAPLFTRRLLPAVGACARQQRTVTPHAEREREELRAPKEY